jgi:hypothetical protein
MQASALLILVLFFLLIDEVGYRFCAFETDDRSNAFGDDSRVWIQLLGAFNRDRSASQFFEYAHGSLLCSVEKGRFFQESTFFSFDLLNLTGREKHCKAKNGVCSGKTGGAENSWARKIESFPRRSRGASFCTFQDSKSGNK